MNEENKQMLRDKVARIVEMKKGAYFLPLQAMNELCVLEVCMTDNKYAKKKKMKRLVVQKKKKQMKL